MKESLSVIGFGTVIVFCSICTYLVVYGIARGVRILKYCYKEKHRYDKPPTAKCYCKDCTFHNNGVRYGLINAYTSDEFFCCMAERKENEK